MASTPGRQRQPRLAWLCVIETGDDPEPRRKPGPDDIVIEIAYCGVCHADIHTARSEWGPTTYPSVPGHEIVGRVAKGSPWFAAWTPEAMGGQTWAAQGVAGDSPADRRAEA